MNNNKVYILNSLKTIIELLHDRKLNMSNISVEQFYPFIDANLTRTLFSLKINKVRIIYYLPSKIKKKDLLQKLTEDSEEGDTDLTILVLKEKLSQNNMKELANFNNIQLYDIKELQYNITKHVLVPKHELITDENEIKNIMEGYSLKNKYQLPHILKSDPMSRYLGLKSGDIVKITKVSPTAGEYIIYRCCL